MSDIVSKYAKTTHLTEKQAKEYLNDGDVQYVCCEVNAEDVKDVISYANPASLRFVSPVGHDCGLVISTVLNESISYLDNLKTLCLCGLIAAILSSVLLWYQNATSKEYHQSYSQMQSNHFMVSPNSICLVCALTVLKIRYGYDKEMLGCLKTMLSMVP